MNRHWLITILGISFFLLAILKTHELNSLKPYMQSQRTLKLNRFTEARARLLPEEQDLLELWESMLTGRSAPLSKLISKNYQDLGLKHVFTPSGFHLSAVLHPLLKLTSSIRIQIYLLIALSFGVSFLPGMQALKRMTLIKCSQKLTGMQSGFILALLLDMFFGSFQSSALSFTYSFLFLGLIYSGAETMGLIFWFFIGQMLIAYFQGTLISPLLILWCPILNCIFTLILPFLFALAFPLWNWQLQTGILLLTLVQKVIYIATKSLVFIPFWEINFGILFLILCFVLVRKIGFVIGLILLSNTLDSDIQKYPSLATNEFRPHGILLRTKNDIAYYSDGKCKITLIQGIWWTNCRPIKKR